MGTPANHSTIQIAGSEIRSPCHACAFFHSREEYYEVLLPFIRDGIVVGDKTLHVVEVHHQTDHLQRLTTDGVPVQAALESGQFEMKGWNESYIKDGRFDQHAMMDLIVEVLNETKSKGYARSRLVGNMEWACVKSVPGVIDLVEYEARLNKVIALHNTVLICCYDIHQHPASVLMDVLRTHPYVIMGGTMHENPFFVSPEQLIAEIETRRTSQQGEV